ncbi:MAG TPA: metallophosphoesterase [Kiritimatiellia bacterium]|nr:metallophosphoesterase [Kiritimatiellia bacterium]HRU69655.1 metallophosphoesterase [Kiritimatiellia bacterium]
MEVSRKAFLTGGISALAGVGFCAEKPVRQEVVIAHCGDPQIGFCSSRAEYNRLSADFQENYRADLMRLEAVIDRLNGLRPDLVYFAGDMMQNPTDIPKEWPRLLKKIKSPVIVTPGNHDVGNKLTAADEDRFIDIFGYSYKTIFVKGWRFIAMNTQYWMPTEEKERQGRYREWLKGEFAAAQTGVEPVIVAGHIPPFAHTPNEKDGYSNCPEAERTRFLDACLAAGARLLLAGHTHAYMARGYKALEILNAETTCCNFDWRPFGFRLLKLSLTGDYTWNFIGV